MADKPTTTKRDTTPGDAEILEAVENLKDVMARAGIDPALVDAQLHAVIPNTTNLVGNFADLQRIGGQLAMETGGIADAAKLPADVNPETGETVTLEGAR